MEARATAEVTVAVLGMARGARARAETTVEVLGMARGAKAATVVVLVVAREASATAGRRQRRWGQRWRQVRRRGDGIYSIYLSIYLYIYL